MGIEALQVQGLIGVREAHRFDEEALDRYLRVHLDGYRGNPELQQFAGGQSNPTFLLKSGDRSYVVRKKPPGALLPTAHMIEREYRIYRALEGTGVPVPRPCLLCEDASIIGTPFYVMDYVQGRVLTDWALSGLEASERRAIYDDMNRVLAALHSVDIRRKGLQDYGRPGNYFERQLSRWIKQYIAAQTRDIEAMNRLIQWLPQNVPADDTTSIVHGDYQLYNLMLHPTEPRFVALLDWELSTLGHPMADLAYNCMIYHKPEAAELGEGVPSEEEYVALYCERTGRAQIENWNFYVAFAFFRLASILQGVYKRGLQGNASSASALEAENVVDEMAGFGWQVAQGH